MSPERKERWVSVALWLVPLLVSLGVAWGTLRADIADKLPTARFVADSINRDGTLRDIQQGVNKANASLQKLICRSNPNDSVCQ